MPPRIEVCQRSTRRSEARARRLAATPINPVTTTRAYIAGTARLVCATAIVFLSYGSRQSFGIYLRPITEEFGWGRESLSLVLGVQALIYGLSAPFVGAIADRFGPVLVLSIGAVLYTIGFAWMTFAASPTEMYLSGGVMVGFGLAGVPPARLPRGEFGSLQRNRRTSSRTRSPTAASRPDRGRGVLRSTPGG